MRSPKDMRTIQIDITNACIHQCSNCTRFCGHHNKPFFMDWETFTKAVDSLSGFNKRIGIMGGEPTLHPQFERFVRHIGEKYPSKIKLPAPVKPISNFVEYIRDRNFLLDETLNDRKGPGLWTSICDKYYEYYELIQDVFSYQCLNDHQNFARHQPLLVSRKELGIPDDEWIEIRDRCWIQNTWSATITPKGAFFCEVAGALDMLFDGPGGWKIEPGWWKREPKDFGYQLQWCEICGGAIFNEGRISNEEIDDVSPLLYEMLNNVGSPKVKRNMINILDMSNPKIDGIKMPNTRNRYMPDYQSRVSQGNSVLKPKAIEAVVFCYSERDFELLKQNIEEFSKVFDFIAVANMKENISCELQEVISKYPNAAIIESVMGEWGRTLNRSISTIKNRDWICIVENDTKIPKDHIMMIRQMIINPGCLYKFDNEELKNKMFLFNLKSSAIKTCGYDGIGSCKSINDFIQYWDKEKIVHIDENSINSNKDYVEDWFKFTDSLEIESKELAYKCLEKIKKGN